MATEAIKEAYALNRGPTNFPVIGKTSEVMSFMTARMLNTQLATGAKMMIFDKDRSSGLLTFGMKEKAVRDEMKRRKVRFLPIQVIRRITSDVGSLNPFDL